jgi:ATP-binding cassette, subfamily B (MDR/TAP), member 9
MLVRNGDLTGGELVSFLLYLQSLSDAFATIGYVFSSLTQAVGAADKVFELMHRQPRYKRPSVRGTAEEHTEPGVLGIEAKKVRLLRTTGQRLSATETSGRVELDQVTMYYPARPQRRILNGLSLVVEPGSVVALVGKSGESRTLNLCTAF